MVVLGLIASALHLLAMPAKAVASGTQLAIIEDDQHLLSDPLATLATFRMLGADTARVFVKWAMIAPRAASRTPPDGFNAADPAAYPSRNWDRLDAIVRDAQREGIGLELTITGGAPRWAEGAGIPSDAIGNPNRAWRPSARHSASSCEALATRYSGSYPDPAIPGQDAATGELLVDLERAQLRRGPRAAGDRRLRVLVAPIMYRAASSVPRGAALQATGHGAGHDPDRRASPPRGTRARRRQCIRRAARQLWDDEAAAVRPGPVLPRRPLQSSSAAASATSRRVAPRARRALRGSARIIPACSRRAGSRIIPIPVNEPPNQARIEDPTIATFPIYRRFERSSTGSSAPVRLARREFPIYNNEFGYITHPPNNGNSSRPSTAAVLHQLGRVPHLA